MSVEELLEGSEKDYQIRGRKSLLELHAHLRAVRSFFGLHRALAVTSDRLRDCIVHGKEQGAAPATINRELAVLRHMFNLAVDASTMARDPKFPSLPEHNTRQGFFERGEFEPAKAYLPPHLQDVAHFAYLTGLWKREITSLIWAMWIKVAVLSYFAQSRSKMVRIGRSLKMTNHRPSLSGVGCPDISGIGGSPLFFTATGNRLLASERRGRLPVGKQG
jgi:hypothetical protein